MAFKRAAVAIAADTENIRFAVRHGAAARDAGCETDYLNVARGLCYPTTAGGFFGNLPEQRRDWWRAKFRLDHAADWSMRLPSLARNRRALKTRWQSGGGDRCRPGPGSTSAPGGVDASPRLTSGGMSEKYQCRPESAWYYGGCTTSLHLLTRHVGANNSSAVRRRKPQRLTQHITPARVVFIALPRYHGIQL